MLIIRNPEDAYALPSDHPANARLDLLYLGPILVIAPGDTEQDIINEIGFSPLVNMVDGERFPSSEFTPNWEWIALTDGWFEQVYVTCNDGSGVMIFIPDDDRIDADLIALCRRYG
ncbi:MAG: hypothetical protein EP321_03235 [Sphingomonadales bacterium]|nr:MAG: hypothetical protein EP345_09145 [Sphingomonadales bacterium]TNF05513.1 MAG: hypothetical protein EP321_03235 [Sphingomonadales bacterium]